MRRGLSLALFLMVSGLLLAQEAPAPNPPPPTSSEPKTEEQTADTQKADDGSRKKKKKSKRNKNPFSDLCIHVAGSPCYTVNKSKPEGEEQKTSEDKTQKPESEPVPRSDSGEGEYSSSRDTLALAKEKEDKPEADAESEVTELQHYDPHQAEKDIEVGEFYLKRKNYKAAIWRFRSALENKPNYALAIIRLAQALEPAGEVEEARSLYERYLKMLPNGEFAVEARKALERLQPRQEKAATSPPAGTPR